jgi:hypothetical protein
MLLFAAPSSVWTITTLQWINRFFVIPPSSRNTLMGLARYTEQAFVGNGNAIRNGEIGNLYGIPVFTTSNADTTSGSAAARVCLMGHK